MLTALAVFAAQFIYVLLLGMQSLNTNQGFKAAAAGTSFMLGTFGFFLTQQIATAKGSETGWLVWAAYVLAGPLGIVCSMHLHERLRRWFRNS